MPEEPKPQQNDPLSGEDYPLSPSLERERRKSEIPVSGRHLVPRIVAFVLVLGVAIAAITIGIVNLITPASGLQEVEVKGGDGYSAVGEINCYYYFSGDRSTVNATTSAVTDIYSVAMNDSYRMYEDTLTFEGMNSIGYINVHRGESVRVDARLYNALKKCVDNAATMPFSIYEGPMQQEWRAILNGNVSGRMARDPSRNAQEQEYLSSYRALLEEESNFSISFLEDNHVRLNLSEAVNQWVADHDYSGPILTLGPLRNAYRAKTVQDALVEAGYLDGFLVCTDGFALSFGGLKGMTYEIYGFDGTDTAKSVAKFGLGSDEAMSYLANAPTEPDDPEAYMIEVEGRGTVLRNSHLVPGGIEGASYLTSALLVSGNGDIVKLIQDAYALAVSKDESAFAATLSQTNGSAVYTIHNDNGNVYVPKSLSSRIQQTSSEGFTLVEYGEA